MAEHTVRKKSMYMYRCFINTIHCNNALFVRQENYSADRHLQHDGNKTLSIMSRVGTSHIYSINHRLLNHIFVYNLALRIEMAEGKKNTCSGLRE